MQTAADIVKMDLDFICDTLVDELKMLRGKRGLIPGGAGFLGHYLVQTLTHANKRDGAKIDLTVFDNLSRGSRGG